MERRQFPRIKSNYPVKLLINSDQNSSFLQGQAVDISEGGICVELDNSNPVSDYFTEAKSKIRITTADIEAYAELMWSNDQKYGFKFSEISQSNKTILLKLLYSNKSYIDERMKSIMLLVDNYAGSIKLRISDLLFNEVLPFIENAALLEQKDDADSFPQEEIKKVMDKLVGKADEIDRFVADKTVINELKELFRSITGAWLYQSKIVDHAAKKPFGYPGDYELIETIYNNKEISNKGYRIYDRYLLNNAYAEAVRNRKDLMKQLLNDFISAKNAEEEIKIFNLACGSSREIREFFAEHPNLNKKTSFYCVDFDENALKFSESSLGNPPKGSKVYFVKEDIINFALKPENHTSKYIGMNMVYSIGLADYLKDKILKRLIQFCYSVVEPNGKLIIAFKDRDKNRHAPLSPDWYCDWTFVPRNKNRVLDLYEECKLGKYSQDIIWEKSGIIFYVILTKLY